MMVSREVMHTELAIIRASTSIVSIARHHFQESTAIASEVLVSHDHHISSHTATSCSVRWALIGVRHTGHF